MEIGDAGEDAGETLTVRLQAPVLFDPLIGYWTGEPDRRALAEALARAPAPGGVERLESESTVILRGPAGPVREHARRLRELGLESG